MKRKFGIARSATLALALALSVAGTASAQTFTCPVPADFGAAGGFDFSGIIDASISNVDPLAPGTTAGIWPGEVDGYNDFDMGASEADDEVPLGVWGHLIETIISDDTLDIQGQVTDVHSVVCTAFAGAANILDQFTPCDNIVNFFDNTTGGGVSKASAASIITLDNVPDVEGTLDAGFEDDEGNPCPSRPDGNDFVPFLLGGAGNLLGDLGDVDGDGDDNLTEWQAAVANNPTDYVAARSEFIASTLAGTSITVSVSGASELLVGGPSETYTAITIDPMDAMFSETHTWSSTNPSVVTINANTGVAVAVSPGSAQIVAEGDTSMATGVRNVNVRFAKWFEICEFDNQFLSQGAGLASELGCSLTGGLTNNFFDYDFDVDAILAGATPTPDAFQLALLAYTLCNGGNGPDQATALGAHATNLGIVENYLTEIEAVRDWAAPTTVQVSASPGSLSFTLGGMDATLLASAEDQDEMPVAGTYTYVSNNPAVVTVNGGAVAAGIDGTVGVTVAATGEGSTTIDVFHDVALGAQDTVGVSVDDTSTSDVFMGNPGDLNLGEEATVTPNTVGPDAGETYTIESDNTAVVTVDGGMQAVGVTSATLAAVGTGTANITATGTDSMDATSFQIEVFEGTICDSAKLLTESGDPFPTSGPIIEVATAVAIWDGPATGGGGGGAYAEVLGAAGAATANGLDAGFAALAHPTLGVPGLSVLLYELTNGLLVADSVKDYIAATFGISTEMAATTAGVLSGSTTFADFGLGGTTLYNMDDGSGDPLFDVSDGWTDLTTNITGLAGLIGSPSATATLAAAMADDTLLTPPSVTLIDPVGSSTTDIVGSAFTKFGGFEPLSGESVFAPGVNPADLTNEQIANAVIGAQGDEFDFVAIAAGLDLLSPGSPFVPAAGALGLGILAGGLAFAAAMRLRRRNA